MIRISGAAIVGAGLFLVSFMPLSAQEPGAVFRLISQCRGDAADLCGDVIPGQGRVAACLYSQIDKLQPDCREAVGAGVALKFCAIDARRFCQGVMPGGGRIAACLSEFREELSPNCLQAFAYFADASENWSDDEEKQLLK